MLRELRIKDFGIIESIDLTLDVGLVVFTGETGSGKSLVIDAIAALVQGNISEEDIRYGATEARVEGVFEVDASRSPDVWKLLADKGFADESGTLIISCNARRQGRSTIRINGDAVARSLLRQISGMLIDVYAQTHHFLLFDRANHIDYLDAYAHTTTLRENFRTQALRLAHLQDELKNLADKGNEKSSREDYLRFAISEIERAGLRLGEEDELEREHKILSSVEELKKLSYQVYGLLYGGEVRSSFRSVRDQLREAYNILRKLAEFDTALTAKVRAVESCAIEVEELARDLLSYHESLEYHPDRLRFVEQRLSLIAELKRKYGGSVGGVLDYLNRAKRELAELETVSEKIAELEKSCVLTRQEMGLLAHQLSELRCKAANRMMQQVRDELRDLGLSGVEFLVSVNRTMAEDGLVLPDGGCYAWNQHGIDDVEFFVSTNPGEPVKPLVKVASTGEMSRFMLAIKSVLGAADRIPTLVFDEIDIGVGGKSGEIIGKKLWQLSRGRQVICVTHLPQIAAFADTHYKVIKEGREGRAVTSLRQLDGESRVRELAEMLTGSKVNDASISAGRKLLETATSWKSEVAPTLSPS